MQLATNDFSTLGEMLLMLMFNLRIWTKIWSHKNLASCRKKNRKNSLSREKKTMRKLTRWRAGENNKLLEIVEEEEGELEDMTF